VTSLLTHILTVNAKARQETPGWRWSPPRKPPDRAGSHATDDPTCEPGAWVSQYQGDGHLRASAYTTRSV